MVSYFCHDCQMLRPPDHILGFVYQGNKNQGEIHALQKFNSILPLLKVPGEVGVGPSEVGD
jgi:hypothetical protein